MKITKLLQFVLILFIVLHAVPVLLWVIFGNGSAALIQQVAISSQNQEFDKQLRMLEKICLWAECDLLTYTEAQNEFWTHARMIDAREWFAEKIYEKVDGMHPVSEFMWIATKQEEIKKWRESSMSLFASLADSEDRTIAERSRHNQEAISNLLSESSLDPNTEGDPDSDSEDSQDEEDTEEEETEDIWDELSNQEREQLDEYIEYLDQQQERYQDEFNQHNQDALDAERIGNILFGDDVNYGSGVKDR